MEPVKKVATVIGTILAFGLWIVACPDVKYEPGQSGRCFETTTYAAIFAKVRVVDPSNC